MTVPMVDTTINGRWTLKLPQHRADRPVWAWWEATRLACMHHYLGEGGHVVYDIGAEEGDFPALWASWGNQVAMWEPNTKVWPNIKAIWDANDLLDPLLCVPGFAAERSTIPVIFNKGWPTWADGPVISDHGFLNLCERPESDVRRTSVDDVAAKFTPPTALTIDIEGAEYRALLGAEATLRDHRPLVWVSVHRDFMRDMYGDSPEDLDNLMCNLGYEKTPLTTDHEQHVFYWPKERELFVQ